jgi:hypothetical protein
MELEFQRFESEHYAEYASWFVDAVLNRYLGPMDDEWLEATLSGPESAGVTWAVFRGKEMVAVIETVFDPENHFPRRDYCARHQALSSPARHRQYRPAADS